jgi:hypothetical protein
MIICLGILYALYEIDKKLALSHKYAPKQIEILREIQGKLDFITNNSFYLSQRFDAEAKYEEKVEEEKLKRIGP